MLPLSLRFQQSSPLSPRIDTNTTRTALSYFYRACPYRYLESKHDRNSLSYITSILKKEATIAGSGSNSCQVSHEWFASLRDNNRTNNRNKAPSSRSSNNCFTRRSVEFKPYLEQINFQANSYAVLLRQKVNAQNVTAFHLPVDNRLSVSLAGRLNTTFF